MGIILTLQYQVILLNFSINRGPISTNDTTDTRDYTMTIKPIYVLYDYEKGTYHDIDLYYGKQGAIKVLVCRTGY